jgi:hypothetical protein
MVNVDQQHHVVKKAIMYMVKVKPPLFELPWMFHLIFRKPSNVVFKLERFWTVMVL